MFTGYVPLDSQLNHVYTIEIYYFIIFKSTIGLLFVLFTVKYYKLIMIEFNFCLNYYFISAEPITDILIYKSSVAIGND